MKPRCYNRFLSSLIVSTGIALSLPTSFAAPAIKTGTGTDLTGLTAGVWSGGTGTNGSPASTEIATWDSTSLGAGLTLGSAASWGGISVTGAISNIAISSSGTLTLGSGGIDMSSSTVDLSLTIPVTLGASQIWNVGTGRALSAGGAIGGASMALTKSGAGTLILSTGNSYSGGMTINSGKLVLSNDSALGSGTLTLSGGEITTSGVRNFANAISVTAGTTTNIYGTSGGSNYPRFTGAITGSGTIKNSNSAAGGLGNAFINGNISGFTGTIWFDNVAGSSNNFQFAGTTAATWDGSQAIFKLTGATSGNGALYIAETANATFKMGELTGTGGIISSVTSDILEVGALNTNSSFSGVINAGSGIKLVKVGNGTLALTGANSYANGTSINAGTLSFANGSLGSAGTITMNGGTLQWDGTNTQDVSNRLALVAATNATFNTNGNNVTMASAIGNSNSSALTKTGVGTLTLNAAATYTGATTVNAGTLALGASGALNSASNVTLAAGTTLDVSGLGASATYTLGSGATLTASGTGTTVGTNAAVIKGGATGTVSLGSRPVSLTWGGAASGTDNSHPALTVSQGNLSLSNNQFTVVTASALDVGVYTLVNAPSITGTVNSTPSFTGGSGLVSGLLGFVSISGNSVILTVSAPSATVSASGTLAAVSGTYGTPSSETSFTISGSTLSTGIAVQPPAGFEVSTTSGSGYTGSGVSITVGSPPTVSATTVYVRLAANAPVGGSYDSQNISVSSAGAPTVTIATATGNSVSAKALTVVSSVANNKMFDGTTAATITGTLDSAEPFGTGSPGDGKPMTGDVVTASAPGTFASSAVGTGIPVTPGTFTLGGAAAGNYTLTQPTGLSLSADIVNTAVWTNTAGGSWPVAGNWQNNLVGTGANNTADFSTLSLPANAIVTLDGARTIGNLVFDDQNSTKHTWTLNPSVAGDLTLAVTSGRPEINTKVPVTLGTVLAGNQGLTKSGSGTLTLAGANTFSGGVTISAGILELNSGGALNSATPNAIALGIASAINPTIAVLGGVADNTAYGAVTVPASVTGATIALPQNSATRSYSFAGATLSSPLTIAQSNNTGNNWSQITWTSKITGSGGGSGNDTLVFNNTGVLQTYFTTSGSAATHDFSGNIHLKAGLVAVQELADAGSNIVVPDASMLWIEAGEWRWNTGSTVETIDGLRGAGAFGNPGNVTLTINASNSSNEGNRNYSGVLGTMGGVLTKTGSGTQTLSGANTYTNATTINNGTLLVTNTTGSGTGTGAVTVNASGTFGGTGSVTGALTVNTGGSIAPGTTGTGTLTTGAATISGTYACQIDGANSDKLASTGSLTLSNATLAISTLNAPTATSYVIATFTGATSSFTTVTGLPAGYAVDTTSTAGQIKLVKGGYGSWASTNAPSGTPTDDFDGDGVSNALEWVLGGLASTNDQGKLPTVSTTGGNLVFTFVRNDEAWQSGDTTTQIQVGTTLASWPSVYNVGIDTASSSPEVTITDNGTTDTIKLTIPMGADSKKFARLKATVTP